jgi:hypothetical protein
MISVQMVYLLQECIPEKAQDKWYYYGTKESHTERHKKPT